MAKQLDKYDVMLMISMKPNTQYKSVVLGHLFTDRSHEMYHKHVTNLFY